VMEDMNVLRFEDWVPALVLLNSFNTHSYALRACGVVKQEAPLVGSSSQEYSQSLLSELSN